MALSIFRYGICIALLAGSSTFCLAACAQADESDWQTEDTGSEAEAGEATSTPDEAESVAEAEQAICSPGKSSYCYGWDGGGRRCLALCAGYGYWMDTGTAYWGAPNVYACDYIDKGQCGAAGAGFCASIGSYTVGACWGWQN